MPMEDAKREIRYKQKKVAAVDYLKRVGREDLMTHELVE